MRTEDLKLGKLNMSPESAVVLSKELTLAVFSPDFWRFQNNTRVLESPTVQTKHC